MTVHATSFRQAYAQAFDAFLEAGSETALHAAYELGRDAVARELTLLELALTHHEVLLETLARPPDGRDAEAVVHAAADFQLEALSAYEVIRRGFGEAVDAITIERRQAAMFRRLSGILADTSLAGRSRSALTEVLQLVVEQARELTDAECSVARAELGWIAPPLTVASRDPASCWPDQLADDAFRALPGSSDSTRAVRADAPDCPGEVLAAPLLALDGRAFGVLAIGARESRRFGELDDAILVHLAQMAAAALERAALYQR
jgi:Phosphoserine phosphatase RsbU, N-terminal domain/GAF domain